MKSQEENFGKYIVLKKNSLGKEQWILNCFGKYQFYDTKEEAMEELMKLLIDNMENMVNFFKQTYRNFPVKEVT